MNKEKLLSITFAALIIVAGLVYLYGDVISAPVVLGICAVAILGMGAASLMEIRRKGERGFVSYLPAICFFVLGCCVAALCVYLVLK
ncbi:MAG: hypothetical protein IKL24_05045 [Clostridia bacterium]|nr:hypothetical protein [Clostridia bacterium]